MGGVELGSKLPFAAAPWPAFVSLSTTQLSKNLGGFAVPIWVRVYRALTEFTPIERDAQRLTLQYSGQHILDSREDAAPQLEPSATTRANDNFHQFQVRWHRSPSPSALLALGFGAVHAIVSSGLQPGVRGVSTLGLPLMTQSGPAPLSLAGLRSRYELNGLFETVQSRAAGSHSLDFGGDWDRSYITNRWDALGGLEQILAEGIGAELVRWNTPTAARQHVQNLGMFAQDAWRAASWLRVPLGLRIESSSGRAVGVANGIRWTTLEPRGGLVFPITRHGLVLRASWSRYAHFLQGRYLDFGNATALGGQVFRWRDLDGDGVAQPPEVTPELQDLAGHTQASIPVLHDLSPTRPALGSRSTLARISRRACASSGGMTTA